MTASAFDVVTLGIAIAGLLLGLRSAWRDWKRDRVGLRVIPKIAYPVGPMPDPRPRLAFEIINEGTFPVTVDEVGFLYKGIPMRGVLTVPILEKGDRWPHRLDPHASITVYSAPEYAEESAQLPVKCAYVATSSGQRFTGRSQALTVLVRRKAVPPAPQRLSTSGIPGYLTVSRFADGEI